MTGPSTNNKDSFFARKEQAEFVMRVYRETPAVIRDLFRQENELLLKALGESRRVLEIGCGFGRAVDSVPSGSSYFGIDIGLPYIVEASHLHPNRLWICGDATRLPLPDRCFDTAFCIQNTLGNMIGLEAAVLTQAQRILRASGRLILSLYSEDSFEIRRMWYDRLVDIGIFRRFWLDSENPRIARSDTGWSSRCYDKTEIADLLASGFAKIHMQKLDSFLYFVVAQTA
ncbi:MAG TPA: methyltransferase domain-containing protein [Acidobacteriota bacterium]|nr:methyltransferase domain-containing protein [Acidobacteriota bacterium]